jgi:hypothetical protein
MITDADSGKVIYLSVGPEGGPMERFDDFDDAVAHATARVESDNKERTIFIAMPRARVRMAVRVDPVELPLTPASELADLQPDTVTFERSQDLASGSGGAVPSKQSDVDRDRKPVRQVEAELERVAARLQGAQLDYEQARSKGDGERIEQLKLRMKTIEADHQGLKKYLSKRLAAIS